MKWLTKEIGDDWWGVCVKGSSHRSCGVDSSDLHTLIKLSRGHGFDLRYVTAADHERYLPIPILEGDT